MASTLWILEKGPIQHYLLSPSSEKLERAIKEVWGFEATFFVGLQLCTQGLLDLDGRNTQKYLHQTWADF